MPRSDLFHFEQRRAREGAAPAAVGAAPERPTEQNGKKIVDWGEDGKPVFEDGSVGEALAAEPSATPDASEDKAGLWTESWGGHTDSKPHGASPRRRRRRQRQRRAQGSSISPPPVRRPRSHRPHRCVH